MTQIQSFAFDPVAKGLPIAESSNDSVLRVVWICFDADQFRVIVHDSDRTRSLLLAAELFPCAVTSSATMTISLGDLGGVTTHENNNFQLGLAAEELVEEATEPGYGDEPEESSVVVDKSSEKQSRTCL